MRKAGTAFDNRRSATARSATAHPDAMPPPNAPATDPRPLPPESPLPSDCCESGCAVCVFDLYADELAAYRAALAEWMARHPGTAT